MLVSKADDYRNFYKSRGIALPPLVEDAIEKLLHRAKCIEKRANRREPPNG